MYHEIWFRIYSLLLSLTLLYLSIFNFFIGIFKLLIHMWKLLFAGLFDRYAGVYALDFCLTCFHNFSRCRRLVSLPFNKFECRFSIGIVGHCWLTFLNLYVRSLKTILWIFYMQVCEYNYSTLTIHNYSWGTVS